MDINKSIFTLYIRTQKGMENLSEKDYQGEDSSLSKFRFKIGSQPVILTSLMKQKKIHDEI